jgi:hypothetical protein
MVLAKTDTDEYKRTEVSNVVCKEVKKTVEITDDTDLRISRNKYHQNPTLSIRAIPPPLEAHNPLNP